MIDSCPICSGSSVHKLRPYLPKSNLPSQFDHRSTDDKLSCGSDLSPRNHAAAPRCEW
jgi:hypothetical protein